MENRRKRGKVYESGEKTGMNLIQIVESVREQAKNLVEERWKEFEELGKSGTSEDLFCELSFCVLTANWSAAGGIKAQQEIGKGFLELDEDELKLALKKVGHRFPNARASYIVSNKWMIEKLKEILQMPTPKARDYIVENAKGIGWKEASHFLRNVGKGDVAILDKHILRIMKNTMLIDEIPKGWTKKRYLSYEEALKPIAQHFFMPLGKLDLYLWYSVKKRVDK